MKYEVYYLSGFALLTRFQATEPFGKLENFGFVRRTLIGPGTIYIFLNSLRYVNLII